MNNNPIYKQVFRFIWPVVFGLVAYMIILLFFNTLSQIGSLFFSREVLFCILISFCIFESVLFLNKKNYFLKTTNKLLLIAFSAINSIALTSLLVSAYFYLIENISVFQTELYLFNSIYTLSASLFQLVLIGISVQDQHQKQLLNKENELRNELKLKIDQFEIQSHSCFLFQNLENILAKLNDNKKQAEEIAYQTADFYKQILKIQNEDLIELGKEFELIKILFTIHEISSDNLKALTKKVNDFWIIPTSAFQILDVMINQSLEKTNDIHFYLDEENKQIEIKLNKQLKLFAKEKIQRIENSLNERLHIFSDKSIEVKYNKNDIQISIPLLEIN